MTEQNQPIDMKELFEKEFQRSRILVASFNVQQSNPDVSGQIFDEILQTLAVKMNIHGYTAQVEQAPAEYIEDTRVIGKQAGICIRLVNVSTSSIPNKVAEIILRPTQDERNITLEYRNLQPFGYKQSNAHVAKIAEEKGLHPSKDLLGVYEKQYCNHKAAEALSDISALVSASTVRTTPRQEIHAMPRPSQK